ncbi:MAG: response regulator transcription factor [Methylococcales bacterium]|nr:response regulator transcription factor [Methylococcales bacterium]
MLSILKKKSILYVEDDPEIQANIAEYLDNFFAKIYLASNGLEALEQYKKYRPDVLILDINLPNIDGLSVAKEIRQHDQAIKIIMLTAYTEKDKLLKATELKLTKYLTKPVPPKVFKETLHVLAEELKCNPSQFLSLRDNYIWDKEQETLSYHDHQVDLTEKEFRLLKLFITHKSSVINYEKITMALWEDSFNRDISIDSIKNQVSHLRKKLPEGCIDSVYGEGYILK